MRVITETTVQRGRDHRGRYLQLVRTFPDPLRSPASVTTSGADDPSTASDDVNCFTVSSCAATSLTP